MARFAESVRLERLTRPAAPLSATGSAWVAFLFVCALPATAGAANWVPRAELERAIPEVGSKEGGELEKSQPPPPRRPLRFSASLTYLFSTGMGRLADQFGADTESAIGATLAYRLRKGQSTNIELLLHLEQASGGADGVRFDQGDQARDFSFQMIGIGAQVEFKEISWLDGTGLRPYTGGALTYHTGEVETQLETIEITGFGLQFQAGLNWRPKESRRFQITTGLIYEYWSGEDDDGGSGLETGLGFGLSAGVRF